MSDKPVVYLAGGMKSDWRETVKRLVPEVEYLDPTTHGLKDEKQYTQWDLDAVRSCDILFGYLEDNSPSGYGLMVEIGVAWSYDKVIVFVDEKPSMRKYTGMAHAMAFYAPENFSEAVAYLKALIVDGVWSMKKGAWDVPEA